MSKNYIFHNNKHKQSITENQLNLAHKAFSSHNCVKISASELDDSVNYIKCTKCNIKLCFNANYSNIHFIGDKINFITCDEYIIKVLIE